MDEEKNVRFDTKKAADYLGVAAQTLANWRHLGRGPVYHKIGRRPFYFKRHLDRHIEEGRVEPEAR